MSAPSQACSATTCLERIGSGSWDASRVWHWDDDVPTCCQFGHVGPRRARELLRGRHIVFLGDSQSRRHLWAVVDAVGGGGRAVRRTRGRVVPDSHRDFDEAAISLNDTLYDSQRAYHAGQTVVLNVDTGRWVLLDPGQVCGVDKTQWMTDHRLTGALSRGLPPPWHVMRGTQYRLRLRVASRSNAAARFRGSARYANASAGSGAARRTLPPERARRAIEALARESMRSWGCQKESIRDCSYHDAIQRNCARRLSVTIERPSERDGGIPLGVADDNGDVFLIISVGEIGGICSRATLTLQHILESTLSDASTGGRRAVAAAAHPIPTRRRLLSLAGSWRSGRGRGGSRRASSYGGLGGSGGHGGGGGRGLGSHAAQLPAAMRSVVASLVRNGPVIVAPHCVSYCRPTNHLECPKSGPTYESAVQRATRTHAHKLGVTEAEAASVRLVGGSSAGRNGSLAVLTFLYAASLETEMSATLTHLQGERSYGHGADLVIIGATWASVVRTRPRAASASGLVATALGAPAAAATPSPPAVELAWDAGHARAWRSALSACAAVTRCLLRTVPETPRQVTKEVYLDLQNRVGALAAEASVGVVDSFSGTWSGVRGGVMAHHDSTRIHFSDTGRAYLAQLTLNALPLLLPQLIGHGAPSTKHKGEIRLDQLVPQPDAAGGSTLSKASRPLMAVMRRGLRRWGKSK